jgi:RNA polymerase sigma factor (sigma-70 family)
MAGQARFEACFREHYAEVLAYCTRRAVPRSAAEDLAAETFAVAWRRIDDLPDEPLPWLYGVARRAIANRRRSEIRHARLITRLAHEPRAAPPSAIERLSGSERLASALASLTELDREAILLAAWEGLDGRGAAEAMGCSRAAYAVRLHRARRKLAKHLHRPGHEPRNQAFRAPPDPANEEAQ